MGIMLKGGENKIVEHCNKLAEDFTVFLRPQSIEGHIFPPILRLQKLYLISPHEVETLNSVWNKDSVLIILQACYSWNTMFDMN